MPAPLESFEKSNVTESVPVAFKIVDVVPCVVRVMALFGMVMSSPSQGVFFVQFTTDALLLLPI